MFVGAGVPDSPCHLYIDNFPVAEVWDVEDAVPYEGNLSIVKYLFQSQSLGRDQISCLAAVFCI